MPYCPGLIEMNLESSEDDYVEKIHKGQSKRVKKRNQGQLTAKQANHSRLVSKIRFIVETQIGALKKFKQLKSIRNSIAGHINCDFRNACAMHNFSFNPIVVDGINTEKISKNIKLRSEYLKKNILDLIRTAKVTLGNGVRETTIPLNYVAFPEEAMTRSAQERGLLRDKDIVKIPKPVAVCQGIVRQAMTIPRPRIQAVTITPTTVPKEDWVKKELMELARLQRIERELYAEPTTLIGAIQELNVRNRGTAVLNRSDSSVEFVCEVKGNPERERKPVVKLTPPMVNEVVMPGQQVQETVRQVVEPVRRSVG